MVRRCDTRDRRRLEESEPETRYGGEAPCSLIVSEKRGEVAIEVELFESAKNLRGIDAAVDVKREKRVAR